MQGDARDGVLVDLEDEVVAEALFDHALGALHQLVGLDALLGQQLDGADVLLLRRPDVLVLVRVDQRAQAVVGEHLAQQAFVQRAVDDVHARNAGVARGGRVLRLRQHLGREAGGVLLDELVQLRHQHLADDLAAVDQAILRRDEDQLDGLQLLGHRHGDAVGVHAIGLAVAVEAERRDDRHDPLREQRLQQLGIDALDLAGEQMVHALEDAHGMGDDHVRAGGAQVVRREPFENLVGQPGGRGERQVERRRVGDAGAVEIRGRDMALVGERRICSAAPCTSTTRMFSDQSSATSSSSVAKLSSVTMPPSIARMNVFSRNCGMYCRMPRRSVSFISRRQFCRNQRVRRAPVRVT